MRKFALIGMLIFGLASPVMADVDLAVNIQKDVEILWLQNVAVDIAVDLDLQNKLDVVQAAKAEAMLNQNLEGNEALLDLMKEDDKKDVLNVLSVDNTIGSINENTGIVGVNQASGNLNNQGNTVAISVVTGTTDEQRVSGVAYKPDDPNNKPPEKPAAKEVAFVQALGAADQKNQDNNLNMINTETTALIEDSVNGNSGITNFNQSPGNFNNQGNVVAIAAGLKGVDVALAEADLGQLHTGAYLNHHNFSNSGLISGSISGNAGITQVNQSAGNMNNQGNVVSIAAVKGFQDY